MVSPGVETVPIGGLKDKDNAAKKQNQKGGGVSEG